jgi:predicted HTH transcriptional regulator
MAKTFIVLTLAMDFIVFGTLAETIASYSGQYAADLEQKQMLLELIREDAYKTESALQENMGKIDERYGFHRDMKNLID